MAVSVAKLEPLDLKQSKKFREAFESSGLKLEKILKAKEEIKKAPKN